MTSRNKTGDYTTSKFMGFDKPRWMAKTSAALSGTAQAAVGSEFRYNARRSRIMQLEFNEANSSGPTKYNRKRIYAMGSTLEVNYTTATPALNPTWTLDTVRIYVPGPEGVIGAREFRPASGGSEKTLVYHYDHLGSITAITDFGSTSATYSADSGGKSGKFSEDAWGQRRDPLDWLGAPAGTTDDGGADSLTPRGFTGHEMLDDLGLVHMNGRIYDPLLGRMLSADVVVQFPGDLQSYNRYSYVQNNPLRYLDPSGFAISIDKRADDSMGGGGGFGGYGSGSAGIGPAIPLATLAALAATPEGRQAAGSLTQAIVEGVRSLTQVTYEQVLKSEAPYSVNTGGQLPNTLTNDISPEQGPITTGSPPVEAPGIEREVFPEAASDVVQDGVEAADPALVPTTTGSPAPAIDLPLKIDTEEVPEIQGPPTANTRVSNRPGNQDSVELRYPDGRRVDINADRVKEWEPATDPRAPAGTEQKVKFDDAQPGSKGYKRDPTPEELEILKNRPPPQ